jgi:translation initiation factor 2D
MQTVYTLWRHPDLLPAFPTWPPVVKKIANGADLMLPGVVVDRELGIKAYNGGKLQKGDPLQVNLSTNRAAFAVGAAALSSEDMYMAGGRGKGVRILHFYGDHLWASGSRQEMPVLGRPDGLDFLGDAERHAKGHEEDGDDDDEDEEEEEEEMSQPVEDKALESRLANVQLQGAA